MFSFQTLFRKFKSFEDNLNTPLLLALEHRTFMKTINAQIFLVLLNLEPRLKERKTTVGYRKEEFESKAHVSHTTRKVH